MNKIRVSTSEMFDLIKRQYDRKEFVDLWIHIIQNGFVFNEFTLLWDNFYIYKVKLIDSEDKGHRVKIKKIYEVKDGTHRNTVYDFSIDSYHENLTSGFRKLNGKSVTDLYLSGDREIIDDTWSVDVLPVMAFMQYVVYEAMHREPIEVEVTKRKYRPMAERTYKPNNNKVYKLIDVVRKYEKHLNHAKRHMTCEHWEVKGHFRHYKNGKVVYIKPYSKGKGKEERSVTDREYRL